MKFGFLTCVGIACLPVFNSIAAQHPVSNPQSSKLVEICDNQVDDDNDGYVDCYDIDCACFQTATCTTAPSPDIKARVAWQSGTDGVSVAATPIVANMNPQVDAIAEIIIAEAAPSDTLLSDRLLFFKGDGSNADAPYVLNIPSGIDFFPVPAPVVGDVNKDGIPELIIVCYDTRIRVYSNYTEDPDNPMTLWITTSEQVDFPDQKPYLADFDADGIPEVYAGNNIFKFDFSDPANPKLDKVLGSAGYKAQCSYFEYIEGSASPVAVNLLKPNECLGNPDCDGLELAAGPVIYSVDVNFDFDGYQLGIQRNLHDFDPMNTYADGYTAVADVNLDGVPELVVASKRNNDEYGVYVWNKYGLVRFMPYPLKSQLSGSMPCIANVYDDRTAGFTKDFPEIIVSCKSQLICFNLQAAQKDPNKPYWWVLDIVDLSSFASCSAFDLNGDGTIELMYQDEAFFRILYGGALPFPVGVDSTRHWLKLPCGSVTSDEYPVIADVDNDGATEIVVSGFTFSGYNNPIDDYRGRLRVFKSDAAPWIPSRQVWNQFGYFGVNVNDDLSIPVQQQAHHLEFPAPGSGKRPFNQFLAQIPVLNEDFEPFQPAPDAYAQVESALCNTDFIDVTVSVCNDGDQVLPAGIPIAFYGSDPTTTAALLIGQPVVTPLPVLADSCMSFVFQIPKVSGTIYGVVNDTGSLETPFDLAANFPVTAVGECEWMNNLFSFEYDVQTQPFDLGPDIAICGDTAFLLSAGTGYLSYLWQDGSTDSVFQVQAPGMYWVEVSDVCYGTRSDSVIVEYLDLPQIELNAVNGDCFGTQAMANVSGSSAYLPISFQWSNGSSDTSISIYMDGTYQVTATDARGCSIVESVDVDAGGQLSVEPVVAEILCAGETGSINLEVLLGKPPFVYSWYDGSDADSLSNLPAGNYAVTISDADGCFQELNIELTEPSPLLIQGIETQASCPDTATGIIEVVDVSQGTPPYNFSWFNGNTSSAQSNLSGGIYSVTVSDAHGCSLVASDTVDVFSMPELQTTVQSISCFGAADGSISTLIANSVSGVEHIWSTGSTGTGIQDLTPGNYWLVVHYGNGSCMLPQLDFQISQPEQLGIQAIAVNPACYKSSDGQIDLTVTGGTTPYSFDWSSGAVTADLDSLVAGVYEVTLTDANGCTASQGVTLENPLPILSAGFETQAACPGIPSGTAIFLGASQGQAPYSLLWSTGSTSDSLLGVEPGLYLLMITDSKGCAVADSVVVPETASLSLDTIQTNVSCYGAADGSAGVIEQSGALGVEYTWSNSGATTPLIQNLSPGQYILTITYGNGQCTQVQTFQVEEPNPFVMLDSVVSAAQCHGKATGSIALNLEGGTAPYNLIWSNGQSGSPLLDLAAGDYTVTATDANGCTLEKQFTVSEPAILATQFSLTADTCDRATGAIVTAASGGTTPYFFQWPNGSTGPELKNLPAGIVGLTVTDANGCTLELQPEVPAWEAIPQVNAFTDTITCADTLALIGLTSSQNDLMFAWSGPAGTLPNQATQLVAVPGLYLVSVTNMFGCTSTMQLVVEKNTAAPVVYTGPAVVPLPCDTSAITLTGSSTPSGNNVQTQWTWVEQGAVVLTIDSNLIEVFDPGLYVFAALNLTNGCKASDSVQVTETAALQGMAQVDSIQCYGASDGTITVRHLTGGMPPLLYSIDQTNYTADSVFTGLAPGLYHVSFMDTQGCVWDTLVGLKQPDSFSVSLLSNTTLVSAGENVQLTVLLSPPNLNLAAITWEPADVFDFAPMATEQTVRVTEPVAFEVLVTDVNGCTASDIIFIRVDDALQVYAPNAIKPGSVQNSAFTIYTGNAVSEIRALRIYDRWGNLVFENQNFMPNDPTEGWDGTYNNKELSPGVFIWYAELELQDGNTTVKKGSVTIVR